MMKITTLVNESVNLIFLKS